MYTEIEDLLSLPFIHQFILDELIPVLSVELKPAVFKQETNKKIISLILKYTPYSNLLYNNKTTEINDLYLLYTYSLLLSKSYNLIESNIPNISVDDITKNFYFPNILYLLSTDLTKGNKFIKTTLKKIYKGAIDNKDKQLLFYNALYSFDFNLLFNDIFSIFLNNFIFEVNPFDLEDHKLYYTSLFSYIFELYLYDKSNNITDFDVDLFLKQDTYLSTRYNIYKESIRLTQIQGMCHESTSLNKIYENFNRIKSNIVPNELQRLYATLIDNDKFHSNKSLILKFNSNECDLIEIKSKYPQIYTLLRSIKIESNVDSSFDVNPGLIRSLLRDKLFIKFKTYLNDIQASIMADTLSIKIENSIINGIYLDPFTLSVVEFSGDNFIKQLVDFVSMILDQSIDSGNTNYV